jgi:hypothetical protein
VVQIEILDVGERKGGGWFARSRFSAVMQLGFSVLACATSTLCNLTTTRSGIASYLNLSISSINGAQLELTI